MKGGEVSNCMTSSLDAGGGVYVGKGCYFTMDGGEICKNRNEGITETDCNAGGVYLAEGAVFTMNNGSINNNVSASGSGVYMYQGATFTMNGGTISDNLATTAYGDESSGNSGVISRGYGGAVFINGGSTFYLKNGIIRDNNAKFRGGAISLYNGALYMSGGEISGNEATAYSGGGVSVAADGEFAMNRGVISGNSAANGGGVAVSGTLTMAGGEVSDKYGANTATGNGGGVYLSGGTMALSGDSPKVSGNTANGETNNVYLPDGQTIAVNGYLAGESIGVTTENKPTTDTYIPVTNETDPSYVKYFVSDDEKYETSALDPEADSSQIVLQMKKYTVSADSTENGTIEVQTETRCEGQQASFTATPSKGYKIVSVTATYTIDGEEKTLTPKPKNSTVDPKAKTDYVFSMPASDVTVSAVFQKLAVYAITFDTNGGTLNRKNGRITVNAEEGSTITIPDAPTRTGYTFTYWKGSVYHPGDKYTVEGDHTFTAQWKKGSSNKSSSSSNTNKSPSSSNTNKATGKASSGKTLPKTGDDTPWSLMAGLAIAGIVTTALGAARRRFDRG